MSTDSSLVLAESNTILRCVVGSTVHGLNVGGGEDMDHMGVCVETPGQALGLTGFDQVIRRTAEERDGKNARSREGDLDLTIYGLRKYLRLALSGNPTIITLLFIPPPFILTMTHLGAELQQLAPLIVSRRAGSAFLGYLTSQRQRLIGERGQKDVNRPELVEKYGFDTKYALHALRLGIQGVELLRTGRITLPMPDPDGAWLRAVRTGGVSLPECLARCSELERELEELYHGASPLRADPDQWAVEVWMVRAFFRTWESKYAKDGGPVS